MKNFLITLCLFSTLSAMATMDETEMKAMEPKAGEVEASRACFKEIEELGCPHPRQDHELFKACMKNVKTSLTTECKTMMGRLYDKKK